MKHRLVLTLPQGKAIVLKGLRYKFLSKSNYLKNIKSYKTLKFNIFIIKNIFFKKK
ncbi:Hypothetical protein Ccan_08320 [Capnocytophaga canimorsus Cc5]|uniref:Uncharacterized protein n=1 Tax=Capnocytophaga canimorsus (strain 5) TaxID=860228 RepID=F9YU95_CAPCC|nr:Hypothetical protein Ccan_08320 [Capnocytophaga canimorsus Cc5]